MSIFVDGYEAKKTRARDLKMPLKRLPKDFTFFFFFFFFFESVIIFEKIAMSTACPASILKIGLNPRQQLKKNMTSSF